MKKHFFLLIIVLGFTTQNMVAQQADQVQRGQRGYIPPSKISYSSYIDLKDPIEETKLILSKCSTELNLDAFQKEILKSMLLKKIQDENDILSDEANSREDRKKKIVNRNNKFFKEMASILSEEQVETYKIMDFTETDDDRKEKKKKKKRDKKKKKTES